MPPDVDMGCHSPDMSRQRTKVSFTFSLPDGCLYVVHGDVGNFHTATNAFGSDWRVECQNEGQAVTQIWLHTEAEFEEVACLHFKCMYTGCVEGGEETIQRHQPLSI